ncbi:conserved hypothetical protein [Leishmania braziliensis MHOM/BR/75/M2904]|uniref:Uncharacterized protein n=2 Tax=Leishmania braziliensis TaxID=5660 RepID=A4H512_LEIBR|nr:conserved hypothetical protein [Leishmania braziliensis MHOM/BR/75/M2904]CAJ2466884.1 unnamed protein product [Leishmania braziliensis]CAM41680.1 conserved hypothetical protein [Leishmania braziliensis MHOM/BR/75/M2904]SYZ63030.1 hypothetical_protein [Leishmania braziliensis MHOM/BR/75/M2904]
MKPIVLSFQIPSMRDACKANARRSSEAAAAAQTLVVPYPNGKFTLQISGIHARLGPTKTSACTSNGACKPRQKQQHTGRMPSSLSSDSGLAADIVVHAHVCGEVNCAPRSYVVAVIPLRFGGTATPPLSGPAPSSSVPSTSVGTVTLPSAPYDKRVINAQARMAHRGVMAPVFTSAFARLDLRTQVERVRLSFTVVPCGRPAEGGAVANGVGHAHAGKRLREEAGKGAGDAESAAPLDCAIDVTVVGTVSAIA